MGISQLDRQCRSDLISRNKQQNPIPFGLYRAGTARQGMHQRKNESIQY
jgi:hypothetical protein